MINRETIEAKLSELNLFLPQAPAPLAVYVPAVDAGETVIVSGQLPLKEGALLSTGAVGEGGVSLEDAQRAAEQCALNALAAVEQALEGDWSRFERVLRLGVFVASRPDFTEQHLVANGASELIGQVLGEAGIHARAAVGVPVLPVDASVEIELLAKVRAK